MKVLILGAGRVGGSLARALVNNSYDYDVSIVDLDKGVLSSLEEKLDIMTVEGHAAHQISFKKAGADDSTTDSNTVTDLSNFNISLSETTDGGTTISTSFEIVDEGTVSADDDNAIKLTFTDGSAL